MKNIILLIALITFSSLSAYAEEPAAKAENDKNCEGFKEKLLNCEPYKCQRDIEPGSSLDNYFIGHEITGIKDGKCHHIQKVSDGTIECFYSDKTRGIIAKMEKNEGKASPEEAKFLAESFEKECTFKESNKSVEKPQQ